MRVATSKKPCLVFVLPAVAHDGISKQVLLQINFLLKQGYDVSLIVLAKVDKSVLTALAPVLNQSSILELKQPDAYLSLKSLFYSVPVAFQIKKFLNRRKAAVVFAHAPYAHFVMRLAKLMFFGRAGDFKLWQYFHALQYKEYPVNTWKRRLLNSVNKKLAASFDDGHVFVSEAVKRDVQSNFISLPAGKVIYNSLPTSVGSSSVAVNNGGLSETDTFTILLPGRVEVSKGQTWFLEPLKEFIKLEQLSPGQVKVVMVGEGGGLLNLKQKVNERNLYSYIDIIGRVDNRDLLLYMRRANVVVVPSFSEGLPIVILEALHQGANVLASDICANREVISSSEIGFLFEVGNVADCVSKLQFLYSHRRQKLINYKRIETHLQKSFSFEKHMQEIISVINKS